MGSRGPIPKRQAHRRRRNKPAVPVERHLYYVCRLPGCGGVVGHVRYDPDGRWCAYGHDQLEAR